MSGGITLRHQWGTLALGLGVTAAFFLGLEISVWWPGIVSWFLPLLILALAGGIARIALGTDGFNVPRFVLLALSVPALVSFVFLLPITNFIHVYLIIAAGIFYWLLMQGDTLPLTGRNMVSFLVLLPNIGWIMAWAFYLSPPFFVPLIVLSLIVGLTAWQSWRREREGMNVILMSLVLAFVVAEAMWVLQFLPFHFMAQIGIIAAIYYVCFYILTAVLRERLTRHIVTEYAVVGLITLAVILWVTPWT